MKFALYKTSISDKTFISDNSFIEFNNEINNNKINKDMTKQVKTLKELAVVLNKYDNIHISDLIKLANRNHWTINISDNIVRINDKDYYIDLELNEDDGNVLKGYEDRDAANPSQTILYHILIVCNPFN